MDTCLGDTFIYPDFVLTYFIFQVKQRSSMKKTFLSPSKEKEITQQTIPPPIYQGRLIKA
jgi:hypothetical protein